MPKVTIIQRVLPHYRVPFFKGLQASLCQKGVELHLIYGQEVSGDVPKTVYLEEEWATRIENRYFRIGTARLTWQPCTSLLADSDLIVFEQANGLLINHWMMLRRVLISRPSVAFWGHGANRQAADSASLSERLKQTIAGHVDWWFAYTALTSDLVSQQGFPGQRITVVNNAIDSRELTNQIKSVTDDEVDMARKKLGLDRRDAVGIYSGGLYPNKQIDILIDAARLIREQIDNFRLVTIPRQSRGLSFVSRSKRLRGR